MVIPHYKHSKNNTAGFNIYDEVTVRRCDAVNLMRRL